MLVSTTLYGFLPHSGWEGLVSYLLSAPKVNRSMSSGNVLQKRHCLISRRGQWRKASVMNFASARSTNCVRLHNGHLDFGRYFMEIVLG